MHAVSKQALADARIRLRATGLDADLESLWRDWPDALRPALFRLLDIGADLPRLAGNQTLRDLPTGHWPALEEITADVVQLQRLVDEPVVPVGSAGVGAFDLDGDGAAAKARLDDHHCVTVESLLAEADRQALDHAVDALAASRGGSWGTLDPDDGPEIHALVKKGLSSSAFASMTGLDLARDTYSLTLSLQSLEATGIGWHRDLYWPREWIGEDVFAVFYALGSDDAEKGGAFVYYLPWHDSIHHFYRRRHQATVLWNSADPDGRILHAVSRYHGTDTRRHLLIAQCLRRRVDR